MKVKNKKTPILLILSAIAILIILILSISFVRVINLSSANEIAINYSCNDKQVKTIITDKEDFQRLTKLCEGTAVNDFSIPSYGFDNIEIVFKYNGRKVYIYPACDECTTMRLGKHNIFFYSISEDERNELVKILEKYGVEWPCV